MIDPGEMRYRVNIEQPVDTVNADGNHTRAWTTLATVWAAVRPATAREQERASQVGGEITHVVHLRPMSTLTHQCRIVWRERNLDISGITYDPRELWMKVDVVEQVE